MSRLECLGRSSKASQKQLTSSLISPNAETKTPYDTSGQKPINKKRRSLPVRAPLHSVQVDPVVGRTSDVQGSVSVTVEEQCAGETAATEETLNITAGVEETAAPIQDLKMKSPQKPQRPSDLTLTGEKAYAPPPVEPLPVPEPSEEEEEDEQSGEEEDEDEYEERRAPLELLAEFLQAVMAKDFQLASKLCQMILVYEPENAEARQFLPLIQEKLLEEQEEEQRKCEDEDDDGDDDDDDENDSDSQDEEDSEESSSDDESTRSSGSSSSAFYSSSASSSSEDDEEQVNQGIRHKLCPPSHLSML